MWRVRLTDAGREAAAEIMRKHPNPVALLKRCWPALYSVAVHSGMDDDDLGSACEEGIVWGVIRHRAEKGCMTTSLAWSVRAAVSHAVRSHNATREIPFTVAERHDKPEGFAESTPDHRSAEPSRSSEELDAMAARVPAWTSRELDVLRVIRSVGMSPEMVRDAAGFDSKQRAEQVRNSVLEKLRESAGLPTSAECDGDALAERYERKVLAFLGRRGRRRSDLWSYAGRLGISHVRTSRLVSSLIEVGSVRREQRGTYTYYVRGNP